MKVKYDYCPAERCGHEYVTDDELITGIETAMKEGE